MITDKERQHSQLAADMILFKIRGGKIEQIERGVMTKIDSKPNTLDSHRKGGRTK